MGIGLLPQLAHAPPGVGVKVILFTCVKAHAAACEALIPSRLSNISEGSQIYFVFLNLKAKSLNPALYVNPYLAPIFLNYKKGEDNKCRISL